MLFVIASSQKVAKADGLFVETVGISVAVGAVLGASTLPFFTQPLDHFANVAIGAGIGALIGLGIWVYLDLSTPAEPSGSALQSRWIPVPSSLPRLESRAWTPPWVTLSLPI